MKKTKIEWCDCTINPVVGCKNGCPYCYARRINDRFHIIPKWDEPQFFPDRLKAFESKKPKSIFVNSMSDIYYWTQTQLGEVSRVMYANQQHNYIMLTKHYNMFTKRFNVFQGATYPYVYIGATVTTQKDIDNLNHGASFFSIEPILEPVKLKLPYKTITGLMSETDLKQIIIGAETGNRKGKVIPKKEWIDSLVEQADKYGIKVFMKDSLIPIVGEENMRRELIWAIRPKE